MADKLVALVATVVLVAACDGTVGDLSPPAATRAIAPGESVSYREIPAGYYAATEENRKLDPYDELVQTFRDRKARDLANPEAPPPFSTKERVPTRHRGSQAGWDELADVFRFDWEALRQASPAETEQLVQAVRARLVFDHPDLKIVELAVGPGGVLPAHAQAGPAGYHVLGGSADITVGESTVTVHPGTSVKLEAFAVRRVQVSSAASLKLLWFSWAPGGRQDYLSYGYYLTGSNFHVQPLEAVMPADYQHWDDAVRRRHEVVEGRAPVGADRAAENRYPASPIFSHEMDVEWLDFTNLGTAAFFWAEDAAKGAEVLRAWNRIVRMKGVFQAKVPEQGYDLNYSYIAIGPHAKYVTHSHATPEFYYILSGKTEWIVEGEEHTAVAGDLYLHAPYDDHEMRVLETGEPMRAVTGSWAPFGDRSVFEQPFQLAEPLPAQPAGAALAEDFDFHRFDVKRDLRFESR